MRQVVSLLKRGVIPSFYKLKRSHSNYIETEEVYRLRLTWHQVAFYAELHFGKCFVF